MRQILTILCIGAVLSVASPAVALEPAKTDKSTYIVFHGPADLGTGEVTKGSGDNYNEDLVIWNRNGLPRAEIILVRLWPDYVWRTKEDLIEFTKGWNYFDGKNLQFGEKRRSVNVLGAIDYVLFTSSGLSCLAFLEYFGESTGWDNDEGIRPNYMSGYYCTVDTMSDEMVAGLLDGLGMRGYKEP